MGARRITADIPVAGRDASCLAPSAQIPACGTTGLAALGQTKQGAPEDQPALAVLGSAARSRIPLLVFWPSPNLLNLVPRYGRIQAEPSDTAGAERLRPGSRLSTKSRRSRSVAYTPRPSRWAKLAEAVKTMSVRPDP